jgi:putative DNA primase/helicase
LTETIPEGKRDATLTSLAGTLRARGLVAEEILPTLMAVNQRRCDPELPECDVVRIAKSVARLRISRPLVETGK